MKEVIILPSFERSVKKLSPKDKDKLAKGLEVFNTFLVTGNFALGFGFKKINHDKYEFRVDLKLRVIVKAEKYIFYLVLAGNHDEIRRYLRNYR